MSNHEITNRHAVVEMAKVETGQLSSMAVVFLAVLATTTLVFGVPAFLGILGTLAIAGLAASVGYYSYKKHGDLVKESVDLTNKSKESIFNEDDINKIKAFDDISIPFAASVGVNASKKSAMTR